MNKYKHNIPILCITMLYYILPFKRLIYNIFSNLYRFYRSIFSLSIEYKPTTIIDEKNEFIKKEEEKFKIKGENTSIDYNTNIEPEFYNRTRLDETLRDEKNTLETIWKTRNLFINTPNCNIIMFYNPYKLAFSYYSDTSSLSYKILNSVAMKYVYSFYCRDLFVDNEVTTIEKQSPLIDILFKDTPSDKKKNNKKKNAISLANAPFAKLKKYSNQSQKTTEIKDGTNNVSEDDKKENIQYMRNKFVRVGKISDFSFIKKAPKVYHMNGFQTSLIGNLEAETSLQKKILSYKDFKQKSSASNIDIDN